MEPNYSVPVVWMTEEELRAYKPPAKLFEQEYMLEWPPEKKEEDARCS